MADPDYNLLLTQARTARHALITGTAVTKYVDQNGESVQYSAANLGDLDAYIRELECKLNPGSYFRPRGPIGFFF